MEKSEVTSPLNGKNHPLWGNKYTRKLSPNSTN
jgi:hypothetical protein